MKRFLLTALAITLAIVATAQPRQNGKNDGERKEDMKIENMVPDLTNTQKKQIETITSRASKSIEQYRKQLKSVRDSIRAYMDSPDDHSARLFPLYEREGALKAEISKEYYRTKIAIDAVLTPEQYLRLKQEMTKKRAQKGKANNKPNHTHKHKPEKGPGNK